MDDRSTRLVNDREYQILVAELKDVIPRRNADLPNLLIRPTVVDPIQRIKQIRGGGKPAWARDQIVRLREDLMTAGTADSLEASHALELKLVNSLEAVGITVNRRNTPVWSVYVVQLNETECEDPGRGWLYVGETSKSPEYRLAQHLAGRRADPTNPSSRVVYRFGRGLRPDLTEGRTTLYSRWQSLNAEASLAAELRSLGHHVEGGH